MRLLTIDDLNDPDNKWQPLLEHIAWFGRAYEAWKALDTGFGRTVSVHMGDDTNRTPGLHASELNSCLRQAFYAVKGETRDIDPTKLDVNMRMRFHLGTAMHSLLQDDFHRVAATTGGRVLFEDEVKIDKSLGGVAEKYDYSSSADGVFTFLDETGVPYLRFGLEIKTMSDKEFEKNKKPTAKHHEQGTFYQKNLDLPLIWYLYYNKSNSNWTRPEAPWIIPFDNKEWGKIEAKSESVHLHVVNNNTPDREEGMHCKWCPFTKQCQPTMLKLHSTRKRSKPRKVLRR